MASRLVLSRPLVPLQQSAKPLPVLDMSKPQSSSWARHCHLITSLAHLSYRNPILQPLVWPLGVVVLQLLFAQAVELVDFLDNSFSKMPARDLINLAPVNSRVG